MSKTHDSLKALFEQYVDENDKFSEKSNKAAGTRVRKGMLSLREIAQNIRKEVQDLKNK